MNSGARSTDQLRGQWEPFSPGFQAGPEVASMGDGNWELGTRARMGQGRTSGVEVRMGVMSHDKARIRCEDGIEPGPGPGPGNEGGAGQ